MKYSFSSDYNELCCKEILERLTQIQKNQYDGYSIDEINDSAKNKLKKEIGVDCDIHFLVGGTQTNQTVIDHSLKPYQSVVAVKTGHINVHETGAIEASGHKVCIAEGQNGKMSPQGLEKVILEHCDEHMVQPKMVYISDSTEIGTIYTRKELTELRKVCDRYGLYLYLDGARLGCALTCQENDLTLHDLGQLCDVFYIGATKNGGMMGEAVVIVNEQLKKDFRFSIKQHGGMFAKGFILGLQFDVLFTDGLYYRLAEHANQCAQNLQSRLKELNVALLCESPTNQIFPILKNEVIAEISKDYLVSLWRKGDKESAIRLVCNYDADEEKINGFVEDLKKLL